MKPRFIIIGNSRTGTSFLRTSIHYHPECECLPEILSWDENSRQECHGGYFENDEYFKPELICIEDYIEKVLSSNSKKAFGFKILLDDIEYWNLWDYLKENDYYYIFTTRNYISSYISLLQAFKTNQFKIFNEGDRVVSPPVTLNVNDFYKNYYIRVDLECRILRTLKNIHTVNYKDMVNDFNGTMEKILAYLNVGYCKTKPYTLKQNSFDFNKRVTNLDEFISQLKPEHEYLKDTLC